MAEFLDDEQRAAYIAALKRELEYKRVAGRDVEDVEAELARVEGTKHERARRATSERAASARRRSV